MWCISWNAQQDKHHLYTVHTRFYGCICRPATSSGSLMLNRSNAHAVVLSMVPAVASFIAGTAALLPLCCSWPANPPAHRWNQRH
jgi:hypothetical protein